MQEKMKNNLKKAKELLKDSNYTCVLAKKENVYTSTNRGVKPLLEWYESGISLKNYSAADKVVGKAAAFLYVLLGVTEVYACVLSEPAKEVLQNNGIRVSYKTLVPAIKNRTNTGFCPMEEATKNITTPEDAVKAVKEALKKLAEK